jgi:hypothetical protein
VNNADTLRDILGADLYAFIQKTAGLWLNGEMKIERGKIHGFSRIRRVLVPKIRVNPCNPWTVFKRPIMLGKQEPMFLFQKTGRAG